MWTNYSLRNSNNPTGLLNNRREADHNVNTFATWEWTEPHLEPDTQKTQPLFHSTTAAARSASFREAKILSPSLSARCVVQSSLRQLPISEPNWDCLYNSLSHYDSVSTLIEVWFHFSEYPKSTCTSNMFLTVSYQTNMTSLNEPYIEVSSKLNDRV